MRWFLWFKRNMEAILQALLILAGAIGVLAAGAIVVLEHAWVTPTLEPDAAEVFRHRTIGTEFAPLAVLQVLPDIFPQYFQPKAGEDWIDHFGFIRRTDSADAAANHGLPVGFCVTNYQPSSASPSPVPFVGLSCAACHSVQFRAKGDDAPREVIFAAGNADLDLIPFFESFRAAILFKEPNEAGRKKLANPPSGRPYNHDTPDLEESELQNVLNMDRIEAELNKKSVKLNVLDRLFIGRWLAAVQAQALKTIPKYDYPFWGHEKPYQIANGVAGDDGRLPPYNTVGPGRTQPFKTLLNSVLDLPVNLNRGYSKIPAVFNQEQWVWSQFDGTIKDHVARSALAAMTAGATPDSLDQPELAHNIKQAAEYTRTARCRKTFAEYFGVTPDAARAERGKKVYDQHCATCHGGPVVPRPAAPAPYWAYNPQDFGDDGRPLDPKNPGPWHGRLVPSELLGTDTARITFRYGDIAPFQLYRRFTYKTEVGHPYTEFGGYPLVHQLEFQRDHIRFTGAYVNGPIDGVFARAPFLHNASVPTLAQLINLKERPKVFYRGKNRYDTADVGLDCPEKPDAGQYYRFDTSLPGNSNAGHDYPWAFQGKGWDKAQLEDLLEYLKTF
ncbi:c-type cytochrome [Limnoglobus roseus]|uniref:Cytochrome c domain-containing protein n=1 Tax=Limnoglobus roseus TaxID=2598579 RepID=A0A5C1AP63_9BACT|nr:cytochrome c [Limnoglobus roseus]QEL20375.1 hypothetical protein PX52LOC_07468 [Limnoglobus roseus]